MSWIIRQKKCYDVYKNRWSDFFCWYFLFLRTLSLISSPEHVVPGVLLRGGLHNTLVEYHHIFTSNCNMYHNIFLTYKYYLLTESYLLNVKSQFKPFWLQLFWSRHSFQPWCFIFLIKFLFPGFMYSNLIDVWVILIFWSMSLKAWCTWYSNLNDSPEVLIQQTMKMIGNSVLLLFF